jgi:pyrroline-5-carboxylate reductase
MALHSSETPGQLRQNVTSPNGTTAAALEVLMNERDGFNQLLERTVAAAKTRSQELG